MTASTVCQPGHASLQAQWLWLTMGTWQPLAVIQSSTTQDNQAAEAAWQPLVLSLGLCARLAMRLVLYLGL